MNARLWTTGTSVTVKPPEFGGNVMVNSVRQLAWAKECPDSWQASLGVSVRVSLKDSHIWIGRMSQKNHPRQ